MTITWRKAVGCIALPINHGMGAAFYHRTGSGVGGPDAATPQSWIWLDQGVGWPTGTSVGRYLNDNNLPSTAKKDVFLNL
jgi:hypothetical protein